MNVYFVLNNITFIWDDEKARINPMNHDGITFQQATEAFFDPFLVVVDASRNEEARDAVITSGRLCQRARCSVESTVCSSH
jgi:uncharacterized protein